MSLLHTKAYQLANLMEIGRDTLYGLLHCGWYKRKIINTVTSGLLNQTEELATIAKPPATMGQTTWALVLNSVAYRK